MTWGVIVCRTCVTIGDHWTFECPYKPEGFVDKPELEKGFVLICRKCGKKDDHWTPRCPYKDLAPEPKGFVLICRKCGKKDDHWTPKCPYLDLAPQPKGFVDKPPTTTTDGAAAPEIRRMNEENSVRVTNLSGKTRELDLGT